MRFSKPILLRDPDAELTSGGTPAVTSEPGTSQPPDELFPSTPTKADDTNSTENVAAENNLGSKIRRATASLGTFAGKVFKKGKGRPRKCTICEGAGCETCEFTGKAPGKLDIAVDPSETENASPLENQGARSFENTAPISGGQIVNAAGAEIFREACSEAVGAAFDVADTTVFVVATKKGHSEKFAKQVIAAARPDENRIERFTKALKLFMDEEQITPKKPGRYALMFCGLGMATGYLVAVRELLASPPVKEEKK